jgi:hypothetical protein
LAKQQHCRDERKRWPTEPVNGHCRFLFACISQHLGAGEYERKRKNQGGKYLISLDSAQCFVALGHNFGP